ncbi:uncharacterized protein LOC131675996 [Topomyia yanbarensis]|uniref:uncharacterized protein LOC131675996 n=1 Tax=Topomyia yanbarensis TaxID=2498891 RepID=UPI00273B1694|nr:uncharacterized protein LOC131675996 [Topomyia yanbarensis]
MVCNRRWLHSEAKKFVIVARFVAVVYNRAPLYKRYWRKVRVSSTDDQTHEEAEVEAARVGNSQNLRLEVLVKDAFFSKGNMVVIMDDETYLISGRRPPIYVSKEGDEHRVVPKYSSMRRRKEK